MLDILVNISAPSYASLRRWAKPTTICPPLASNILPYMKNSFLMVEVAILWC